jgi:hypothetical protein
MIRFTAAAMSESSTPITVRLWLSWPTDEAIAPRFQPEAVHEPASDVPVDAVAGDHRHLDHVGVGIGCERAGVLLGSHGEPVRDDPARSDADDGSIRRSGGHAEIVGGDALGLDALEANRRERARGLEKGVGGQAPAGHH